MTPAEEKAFILGNRAAYQSVLAQCARELHGSEEGDLARALVQLEDVRRSLRRLCAEFGDNDWPDDLHLGDVLEKHLAPHLREHAEDRGAHDMTEAADLPLDSERRGMLAKRSVEAGESCGLCGFLLAYSGPKPVHRIASIPETTHAFRADGSELHVGDVVACGERYREESIGFVHHGIVIETRST